MRKYEKFSKVRSRAKGSVTPYSTAVHFKTLDHINNIKQFYSYELNYIDCRTVRMENSKKLKQFSSERIFSGIQSQGRFQGRDFQCKNIEYGFYQMYFELCFS